MQLSQILKSWRIAGSSIMAELFGGISLSGPTWRVPVTLAYSAAPIIDASLGDDFIMTVTDNVAFVFGAPTNPPAAGKAQLITITIRNTSGGAHGAGTFNAVFKTSAGVPAIATAKSRTIAFRWNGTNWVEVFRTAADVDN